MRFVKNVDKNRFDAFAIASPTNHYSKTSAFIDFKKPEFYDGDLLADGLTLEETLDYKFDGVKLRDLILEATITERLCS